MLKRSSFINEIGKVPSLFSLAYKAVPEKKIISEEIPEGLMLEELEEKILNKQAKIAFLTDCKEKIYIKQVLENLFTKYNLNVITEEQELLLGNDIAATLINAEHAEL